MIADRELTIAYPRCTEGVHEAVFSTDYRTRRTRGEQPRFGSSRESRVMSLTPREREIANLLAAERASNRAISARLSISIRTVETHIERIFAKLDIHTRADVAAADLS